MAIEGAAELLLVGGASDLSWRWASGGRARGRFRAWWDATVPAAARARRSVPFLTSASSTRRTVLRSADQRWSRHLLYSPEMEYLDWPRSKATAPSSRTTAPAASLRKSCTVRVRASGVTSWKCLHIGRGAKSVTSDHRYRQGCGRVGGAGRGGIGYGIIRGQVRNRFGRDLSARRGPSQNVFSDWGEDQLNPGWSSWSSLLSSRGAACGI